MDWEHFLNLQYFAQHFLIKVVGFQWYFLCDCLQCVFGNHLVMSDMVCQPQRWDIYTPISINFIRTRVFFIMCVHG